MTKMHSTNTYDNKKAKKRTRSQDYSVLPAKSKEGAYLLVWA